MGYKKRFKRWRKRRKYKQSTDWAHWRLFPVGRRRYRGSSRSAKLRSRKLAKKYYKGY